MGYTFRPEGGGEEMLWKESSVTYVSGTDTFESGGGGWTRTNDLRIMSSAMPIADKQDKPFSSARPGKIQQIPQRSRNQVSNSHSGHGDDEENITEGYE